MPLLKSLYNIVIHLFSDFFPRYRGYMICLISFSEFSDVLPAFTCARVIGNF